MESYIEAKLVTGFLKHAFHLEGVIYICLVVPRLVEFFEVPYVLPYQLLVDIQASFWPDIPLNNRNAFLFTDFSLSVEGLQFVE